MLHLERMLSARGVTLILLHHFSPAHVLGGQTYHGHNRTAEPMHERLARDLGVTSASLRNATGLPSAWATAIEPAMELCEFACAFFADNIHPNPCGQRFLAQIATSALVRVLRAGLKAPIATAPAQRMRTKCWSVVGNGPAEHNLFAASNSIGWELINLKGRGLHGQTVHVYKYVHISRSPGARIEFRNVTCTEHEVLRVYHLAGVTANLGSGRARVEIDGTPALSTSGAAYFNGYLQNQGGVFMTTDFVMPRVQRRSWSKPSTAHSVAVIALNETDHPRRGSYGAAINALVCAPA